MLILIGLALLSLGTLELKMHRRTRCKQERNASRLAAALRKGALL